MHTSVHACTKLLYWGMHRVIHNPNIHLFGRKSLSFLDCVIVVEGCISQYISAYSVVKSVCVLKVNSVSDSDQMLSASRSLRLEKEREARMVEMKRDLKNQVIIEFQVKS